jgi:hypothetical protein
MSMILCRLAAASLLSLSSAFTLTAAPAASETPDAWRNAQQTRLAAQNDRDSRIAAILLVLPADANAPLPSATTAIADALVQANPDDVLSLYVAALVCQLQPGCTNAAYVDRLTTKAPDNAVHWLLRPGAAAPDDAHLRGAAKAASGEPHLGELRAVLGKALGAPTASSAAPRAAALDAIPLPRFAPALNVCKRDGAARREACIALGRTLFADAHGSILSRMIGSVLLRRLAKGTPDETAAVQFRRDYVWLGEHNVGQDTRDEALQQDLVRHGEWEAWLRAADRAGVARTPAAGWTPANPQQMLLSEERTPAGG